MENKNFNLYALWAFNLLFTFCFFGIVFIMMTHHTSEFKETLYILIGAISAKFSTIVDYFFGSSKSNNHDDKVN